MPLQISVHLFLCAWNIHFQKMELAIFKVLNLVHE
jgi:hypothetical protein